MAGANKRPNKDGSIRQRPDGLWEARYCIGKDPGTNKLIRKSIYGKTQREVTRKLKEKLSLVEKGESTEESKLTLGEWLDTWLEDFCKNIKPSSRAVYKRCIDNYIKPNMGAIKLKDLSTSTIQKTINKLKLSPHTLKDVRGILHAALDKAVSCKYINSNPCTGTEIPKVVKPDICILNRDHIKAYLQACDTDPYGDYLKILLYTGARESEIMGLPWDNVDFEKGTITIDQQLENRTYNITTTKTSTARTFKPADIVMDILRARKAQQEEDKKKTEGFWTDTNNLVFTDNIGNHYAHNTVRKHFHKITASIGLPDMRVHDLRHSYSVLAIQAGEDIKTISSTLGHSTVTTTLDIYARFSEDLQEASNKRMNDFFGQF